MNIYSENANIKQVHKYKNKKNTHKQYIWTNTNTTPLFNEKEIKSDFIPSTIEYFIFT